MSEKFKLIVAGTRSFDNYKLLRFKVNQRFLEYGCWSVDWEPEIVSGGAPGADKLAERYAAESKITLKVFRLIGKSTVEAQAHAVTGRWRNTLMQQ